MKLEAAKIKFEFMTNTQVAFYGPMGYDVRNVIANMIFAWANGDAIIKDEAERTEFTGW